jgi:hypothetical protein
VTLRRVEPCFKVFGITSSDETGSVTVAHWFIVDDHGLWGWRSAVDPGIVATGVNAYQWPTWERALEEALAHISRSQSEPHTS